jgi:hypothetical protein
MKADIANSYDEYIVNVIVDNEIFVFDINNLFLPLTDRELPDVEFDLSELKII